MFRESIRRDLRLLLRQGSEAWLVLVFFLLIASLFPLAMEPDPGILLAIGPGVAWVSALLAVLLSMPRMFAADAQDGSLEQMLLQSEAWMAMLLGKLVAHWLASGLPLSLVAPLIGLQYGLDAGAIAVLVAGLLLGTPMLTLIGAIAAALNLSARGGGALLALLMLPLCIPVLVFGAGAVEAQSAGLGAEAHLSLLAAGLIIASILAPWACSSAIKIALD
ncbi:MAG: heme exporter protein CcmB [Betaproteobacteria bacterium]|nr:heme exporter protein CcmB [Betaproteobacteria bacterium]